MITLSLTPMGPGKGSEGVRSGLELEMELGHSGFVLFSPVLNLLYGPFSCVCRLPDQKGRPLSLHLRTEESTHHSPVTPPLLLKVHRQEGPKNGHTI